MELTLGKVIRSGRDVRGGSSSRGREWAVNGNPIAGWPAASEALLAKVRQVAQAVEDRIHSALESHDSAA